MRRRDFIKGISVWTASPLAARAEPREQKRRVTLPSFPAEFRQASFKGSSLSLSAEIIRQKSAHQHEYRWPGAELDQVSIAANEIVAMRPDLVVSRSTPTTAIMMNRGLPIVF